MSDTFDDSDVYFTDDGLPVAVFHTPNGGDDYDIEPKIPNNYLDDMGVRHCVIWDLDQETRYKWDDEADRMVPDRGIF